MRVKLLKIHQRYCLKKLVLNSICFGRGRLLGFFLRHVLKCFTSFQILPGIQNEDGRIRNLAVKALGLCCVISKDLVMQYLPLFMQVMK